MNFISFEFLALVLILLASILAVRNANGRKWLLLFAGCVFYAWWDWRFLGLLFFLAFINYEVSLALIRLPDGQKRHFLFGAGVLADLLFLAFFKYFNFFIQSFNTAFNFADWQLPELQIILPLGISFFTFEALSYLIDVYRGQMPAARSLLDYTVFITFFPRLVSGPIMRGSYFLPQLEGGIKFSRKNAFAGIRLFGQGLVKKVVVADTLAVAVDPVFSFPILFDSFTVWIGVLAFAAQIYFDFSGYSDMALGVARLLGFELPSNFNLPYTARNVNEFWRRWHISLSTWFRDYVFFPLRRSILRRRTRLPDWLNQISPIMVTMFLSGLWHGAGWNFVLWGGLHGLALGLTQIAGWDRTTNAAWKFPRDWIAGTGVFLWSAFTLVFFRSSSLDVTREVAKKLLFVDSAGLNWIYLPACALIVITVAGGFLMRQWKIELDSMDLHRPHAIPYVFALYLVAFLFAVDTASPFIYFQF